MKYLLLFFVMMCTIDSGGQARNFRFAFISDTHIGSPNGGAEEDLRRTVSDINLLTDIAFVVITGDITELGTDRELLLAKRIFDSLRVPYYIIPGNHDTGWSESGGLSFTRVFGSDKFFFTYGGIYFMGCASGPYVRMSDGHVPRDAINWMQKQIKQIKKNQPVVFLNHYPLDKGLDNWYQVVDMLKTKNTILALCGHGHNNRQVFAEDIPSVMGRSNLRAKDDEGGYNIVDVKADSIHFIERKPLTKTEKLWIGVKNEKHRYDTAKKYPRPDFSNNESNPKIKAVWSYSSAANVISTPVVVNDLVIFGNQSGLLEALDIKTGKRKWKYQTRGPIFSSPAVEKGFIVFGSADGTIYCLNAKTGKFAWKMETGAAVLGSPLIENNTVFIGGSDGSFRAIDLIFATLKWKFSGIQGPVVSKPVTSGERIIFGAWDKNLYAVNKETGQLLWKWNNGSPVINFSPAACIPVVHNGVVYIVAPDRYLSAIDEVTGTTLWRTNEVTVRESIGISENGEMVYGKSMQDTVAAFYTNKIAPKIAWKINAGYGYEHAPSMLIEKEGHIYFGTRNGVVYAMENQSQKISWTYKIDNSMVNTVKVLNNKQLVVSTMDGKVCLLQTN